MTNRLRYEEEIQLKLNYLPLPDENMAWKDMKRRLEEEDDGRVVPVWLRGCIVTALLGLSLFGAGWWFLSLDKFSESRKSGNNKTEIIDKLINTTRDQRRPDQLKPFTTDTIRQNKTEKIDLTEKSNIVEPPSQNTIDTKKIKENTLVKTNKKDKDYNIAGREIYRDKTKRKSQTNNGNISTEQVKTLQIKENKKVIASKSSEKTIQSKNDSINLLEEKDIASEDISLDKKIGITAGKPDSSAKIVDTVKNKQSEQALLVKKGDDKDSTKRRRYSLAAGIAMHQQLPINGQKLTPYNSLGRKASLADYIPSVYLRLYRENKWYLQSEFRYGAPQYNKSFIYDQQERADSFSQSIITQSTTLKKTFYHQLPVTFNYFILPNWSAGAGIICKKF